MVQFDGSSPSLPSRRGRELVRLVISRLAMPAQEDGLPVEVRSEAY